MNITATGSKREWNGPKENYLKHHEVIDWWCEGGEVEWLKSDEWLDVEGGFFRQENEYRIKQRELQAGSVWLYEGAGCLLIRSSSKETEWYCLTENEMFFGTNDASEFKYISRSLSEYYARKFYEQSNDGHVAMSVLKEACRYED